MPLMAREGERAMVRLGGDVVAASCPGLRTELLALVAGGARELVLDARDVGAIDSIGLKTLIATHNSLERAGGRLELRNSTPDLRRLLETMRLHRRFSVL